LFSCSRERLFEVFNQIVNVFDSETEMRIKSSGGASCLASEAGMLLRDIRHGSEITEPTQPKLTAISNRRGFRRFFSKTRHLAS
jgi:hypothetical protein